ncbi:hypothetical protein ACQ4PT_017710 [Festuca glaucescens]
MADPPAQQHPACCACKHQRRKCSPGCPLAPYFPADRSGSFRSSHRLFGIKNILRLMAMAGPQKQDDCMRSIMYEADARVAHPVHGPYTIIHNLRKEDARARAELQALQEQLAKHRRAPVQQCMPPQPLPYVMPPDEHPQPFYGGYAPPGAVEIDGDATVGANVDEEDAVMSMQHDYDDDEGHTLAGAHYGGDVPSSSSYQSSDTSPPRLLNRRH